MIFVSAPSPVVRPNRTVIPVLLKPSDSSRKQDAAAAIASIANSSMNSCDIWNTSGYATIRRAASTPARRL